VLPLYISETYAFSESLTFLELSSWEANAWLELSSCADITKLN